MLPSSRIVALRRREQHPNLLAAWGFDEGSGVTARDSSEHDFPLTVDAGLTWPAGHTGGSAIANGGVNSAAHRAWTMSGSAITLMGWARPSELAAGTDRPLFGIWDGVDTSGSTQCAIWAQRGSFGTSNVLQANVRIGGGLVAANHTALTLNTWVHVAVTFDGLTIRLYRNGVEVTAIANTGALSTGAFFFCAAPSPAQAEVDDVRIFNAALGVTEIATQMGDPVAP